MNTSTFRKSQQTAGKRGLTGIAALLVLAMLAACGGGGDAGGGGGTETITAVIGPAGGTLTGPDGVQVIVPAGALLQPTTIGIARSSAGAPAALPEDNPPAGPIYEFTPHGLVFNTPVTIRIPVPPNAVGSEVFMASFGEDWQVNDATLVAGFAEWQRNSFSFGMLPVVCAPANNPPYSSSQPDPFPCAYPRGAASASATPPSAITRRTSGSAGLNSGDAGSWVVNQASTVTLTLRYVAVPDCANPRVRLLRFNPAVPLSTPGRVQTLLDQAVVLTQTSLSLPAGTFGGAGTYVRGVGNTTFDVSLSHLDNGTTAFGFSFSCNRPFRSTQSGGDLLTFISSIPVPSVTHTIGGAASGLTGAGLVLRNNGGDNLAVPANGSFTFAAAIAAGAPYNVSVLTQPSGQTCTVQNGSGTAQANVTNVAVSCTANTGPVPLLATAIAAGFWNSLAVATDGTVWAWGYQVDPTTGGYKSSSPWATQPVQVQGLTNVRTVALSSESGAFYALHNDGTVSAWGRNDAGQLGDRTTTTRMLPVQVLQDPTTPMDEVCSIAASSNMLLMARATGCSPGQRPINYGPWIVGLFIGQNFGGDNAAGFPFNGAIAKLAPGWPVGQTAGETASIMTAPDAANAGGAVAILTGRGDQYVWGDNGGNRLSANGVQFAGSAAGPVPPSEGLSWSGFFRAEFGRDFSIRVSEVSTLYGVGRNLEGQLGNGTTNASLTPTPVLGLPAVSGTGFSVGQTSVAAITGGGELWAWGWNGSSAVTVPQRLGTGTGFTQVSVGDNHSLAIGPGGEVYSWGDGTNGGLGNGATSGSRSIPAVVMR